MGLAASQARLLLLTARKSDLEYRAQQITNAEMILAMQTETVAREYSIKISNQTIKYIDANSQDQTTTDLSASALLGIAIKSRRRRKRQSSMERMDTKIRTKRNRQLDRRKRQCNRSGCI